MVRLHMLKTVTYKDLEKIWNGKPLSKMDKFIYSISIKIRCKIDGHSHKEMKWSLCHGYLDDRCERCGERFWKLEDFDFWGGPKTFYELNKPCLTKKYWDRLRKEFPELEEF